MSTKKAYYIDNKTFYNELIDWYSKGDNIQMPDSIARAIIQICENLARSGKFVGYTWKDDMVQEAILVCVKSARNFNPDKSTNPFAYFTQIAFNAFRRFLNIEHTRLATIENYKQSLNISFDSNDDDIYEYISESARNYDRQYQKNYEIKKRKNKKQKLDVENFFE